MHRRVRQATIAAVMVAVILLGVPLAFFGAAVFQDREVQNLEARAEALARSVDRRLAINEPLTTDMLDPAVNGGKNDLKAYVMVWLPDGTKMLDGNKVQGKELTVEAHGTSGAKVTLSVSYWDVFWRSMQAVIFVFIAAAIALAAGIWMATWQSRRLTAPLVYLAASAEQLGSGQVRPRLEKSGIEEIDLVAEELARSADRMAGRLAAERQFASDASHQLRTPLTALSMRLEEIQLISDEPEVQEEARICLEQIERLTTTVDELLGRSRRAGTAATAEAIHLHEITGQQEEEWSPAFAKAKRELTIDVPTDLTVLASPGALAQVLATLLENSLKHGDGTTFMRARSAGPRGGVVIEVGDEGPGVSDEMAPKVFERNVTSGSGTGLGLALARDLVAADGGRLELAQRRPPIFAIFLSGLPKSLDPDLVLPRGAAVNPSRRQRGRGAGE